MPRQEVARVRPLARFTGVRPVRALALPLIFTTMLFALCLLPSARTNTTLLWSFCGVGAVLLAWNAALLTRAVRLGRTLTLEVVLRNQHYVQACAQLSVFVYWGWYWRQVYQSAYLIVAQLVFAYALDALLAWSRRDTYTLGFGPFPIILSINLFLWFKPDWFFLQFLLVALGFAAKELIRWTKNGQRTHIFNPSSFPLALFSTVLLLSGTTHLTWGQEIATTQLYPPYIYLLIFLVALPGQFLFGVTLMTMSAVVTAYACILSYGAASGTGFIFETYIPIATFLGMHLLFNDPSTSPRTDLGRVMFGMLYGLSVVVLYALLEHSGTPSFYDKLLAVPILNLMIQGIDRAARSEAIKRFDPTVLVARLAPRRRSLAYMSVWVVVFTIIQSLTSTDQEFARQNMLAHSLLSQGQIEGAISQFRVTAERGNAEAQSNLGVMYASGKGVGQDDAEAVRWYRRSAEQGYDPAQFNLGGMYARGKGVAQDYVEAERWYRKAAEQGNAEAQTELGVLYATGRGVALDDVEAALWYREAAERGNTDAQYNLGFMYATGRGVALDDAEAMRWCRKAAEQGHAEAQYNLGSMFATGWSVAQDDAEAERWYRKAAEQGHAAAQCELDGCPEARGEPSTDR
jgi:TPR repeat protein